ncbi:MAG: PaaI family thioesterase [Sneathiellales bacterium]|nr:PaaI family thioesterase [Sneathiellales bacterium]
MSDRIDSQLKQRLLPVIESQKFMHHLGVEITALQEGLCEMTLDYKEDLSQQNGFFHGGVIGTLADNAAGAAGATVMTSGENCLTAEYKLNFLSPAKGDKLVAIAKILKSGRSLKVAETNIYSVQGETRKHCAVALVTLIAV